MTDRLGGDGFIGELATALSFISGERKSSGSKVERASEVFQQQASKEEISVHCSPQATFTKPKRGRRAINKDGKQNVVSQKWKEFRL